MCVRTQRTRVRDRQRGQIILEAEQGEGIDQNIKFIHTEAERWGSRVR